MAITTVTVTCTAFGQDGQPIAGAIFKATLDKVEIFEGMVVPQVTTATTNASGIAVMNLWPNELGERGSSYFVTGIYPNAAANFLEETAVIPNEACNLESVILIETFPPLIPVGHVGVGGTAQHPLVVAGGTAGFMSGTDKTKLDGVATGATANSSDATLLARANHTGTQLASTISDFAETVRSTVITGLSLASSTVIAATDTVLAALGQLQAQITLRATLASPTFTGTPAAPTAVADTNTTQLATTAYVFAERTNSATITNKTFNLTSNTFVTTSAQLATALTDETGTGLVVFSDSPTFTGTVSGITKSMVGLSNVDNTADASKPVSTATQAALDLKAPIASPTFTGTVSGITKAMVGLTNVDDTADTAKPVSTAQQTALDLKANLASPTLTGTPLAPTAAAATNTTQIATTAHVFAERTNAATLTNKILDAVNLTGVTTQGTVGTFPTRFGPTAVTPDFAMKSTSSGGSSFMNARFTTTASGPSNFFVKGGSASVNTYTLIATGDVLGNLSFGGTDGTQVVEGARISVICEGTPAANSIAAAMVFYVNAGATSSPLEAFRFSSDKTSLFSGKTGYGSTAAVGGTVTQATSKTTGVTLNKVTGQITLNASSLAASTTVVFTLTNSFIGANDRVIVHRVSGGTAGSYIVGCDATAAGSCAIYIRNTTEGALAEAVVLQFSVLGGVIA